MKFCKKCRRDKPEETFITAEGKPSSCCGDCLEKNRRYRKLYVNRAKETGKVCSKCGKPSPAEGFPITRWGRAGSRCELCREALKRYYLKNKETIRRKQQEYYKTPKAQEIWAKSNKAKMERFYGLVPNQKEQMYEQQKGVCSICKKHFKILAVDHNHVTGQIRELLCKPCNLGLGNFRENPQSLQNAIDYLNRWSSFNSTASSN
jgi:hypothetical protein